MSRSIVGIKRAIVAGLLAVACVHEQAKAQGGAASAPVDSTQLAPNGNYYALVIGVNDYSAPLPKLVTAVADARSIAQVLSDSYGFQVKLLLDQEATRSNILRTIAQYRYKLNESDNLLIYYAGHGISDRRTEKAYWIPVDADSVDSPNRIIADDITSQVSAQSARHVLIISDSCYSGGLTRGADTPVESAGQIAYLNRVLKSRSRTLMSSGGDEPVSDGGRDGHSVFAYALLRSLQQTDESVFTASDLFVRSVRQQVAGRSSQLPEYSIIRNSSHDDGDFVFVRTVSAAPNAKVSVLGGSELWAKGKALADANRAAEALPLFQQACDAGDGRGCTSLGYRYESGLGVAKDLVRAARLYRQACDGNYASGCNNLGLLYVRGFGVEKDIPRAVKLFREACDGRLLSACSNLGYAYENGFGVDKDEARAVELFRQVCDGNEADGCRHLGYAYENGLGVEVDPAHASTLYRQACDGFDAVGCTNLGLLYDDGTGVKKDPAAAAKFFRLGCDRDNAGGCYSLALAYRAGVGVGKDLTQADALFRKSCALGGNGCIETKPK